jgi:hypothetical protein
MQPAMFKAYIGIVDRDGLASFFREDTVSANWLVGRRYPGAVSYWAVLSEPDAGEIRADLDRGGSAEALCLLHTLALEIRPYVLSTARSPSE